MRYVQTKRIFDVVLSVICFFIFIGPILVIALLVKVSSRGPILNWSVRFGRNNVIFKMPKFRTMKKGTPLMPTHLLINPDSYITFVGGFLRKSSLDELPQLWSIFMGDMSFVGPRPALFCQNDLIELRSNWGVDKITPGLTGWAQINGRDELSLNEKVQLDAEYLSRRSILFDLKILWLTVLKVIRRDDISH